VKAEKRSTAKYTVCTKVLAAREPQNAETPLEKLESRKQKAEIEKAKIGNFDTDFTDFR
jgi:hypothetical protein